MNLFVIAFFVLPAGLIGLAFLLAALAPSEPEATRPGSAPVIEGDG